MWPCTDKQAKQSIDPNPPHRELKVSEAIGAFISCLDCGVVYDAESAATFCQGTPVSVPLAHPGGVN